MVIVGRAFLQENIFSNKGTSTCVQLPVTKQGREFQPSMEMRFIRPLLILKTYKA
jgi:hypothetical protein